MFQQEIGITNLEEKRYQENICAGRIKWELVELLVYFCDPEVRNRLYTI